MLSDKDNPENSNDGSNDGSNDNVSEDVVVSHNNSNSTAEQQEQESTSTHIAQDAQQQSNSDSPQSGDSDETLDVDSDIGNISRNSIFHSAHQKEDGNSKHTSGIESIDLDVKVVIGTTRISMKKILVMEEGSIIELDKRIGEDIDVYVNENLIAKGEIVIIDHNIGISVTEIIK